MHSSYQMVGLRHGILSHRCQFERPGSHPGRITQRLSLEKGTPATWSEEGGRLVLTPMTAKRLDEIMGFLKPKPGEPSMFEEIFAERERERKREK